MFHSFQWRCIACFLLSEEAPRYWTDPSARTIGRADLDGTRAETLLTTTSPYKPHGMALDLAGGWLYWVDHGEGTIHRGKFARAPVCPSPDGTIAKQPSPTYCHIRAFGSYILSIVI